MAWARAFGHRRTVAGVPMSVLLSGGMDSSLITGLLAETGTPDLRTYAFASKLTCCSRSRPDATLVRTNLFTIHGAPTSS
ncbi:asparagine synthase-related protein [Cupriavidus basilensis]|uniref:asparagine synthase-related protein n=1 Tax=Cupriavidus basilensis TaxID=68895 RepID=UPI0020C64351|nr:asparagine synthase-related protein [Cupriavidus basilensis]